MTNTVRAGDKTEEVGIIARVFQWSLNSLSDLIFEVFYDWAVILIFSHSLEGNKMAYLFID